MSAAAQPESLGGPCRVIGTARLSLKGRLLQLQSVIFNAWPAWVAITGVVLACGVGWCLPWPGDNRVSVAGMLLQLLGIATVAVGLSQARRQFGRPSVKEQLIAWVRRAALVFAPSKSVVGVVTSSLGSVTITGTATVRGTLAPGVSLERRVEALEQNLRALQTQVDKNAEDLRAQGAHLKAELEREARERREQDHHTVRMIEEFAVGGLHLEGIGLFWLSLGVVGTSMAGRIASWLGWLP